MADTGLQLLRGTLDMLILKTLTAGPLHGYAVAERIAERTQGVLGIEDGALYQSLHRMEERGWVESEWGRAPETGKRARYYRLTDEGCGQLRLETASFQRYVEAVFRVLEPAT
ncbi:MAG TPA: PadR family transcriptional regulator [Longimicrobiaceae bacterium]|nr:PadR family transcriptional regulator [Longimicrobiaceae bacterium]